MIRGRSALLIGTGQFDNPDLQQLRSPTRDIEELASVLKDPKIGDFEVTVALDQKHYQAAHYIESFFRNRGRDDLLLIHISSHGLKADHGELYFASRNTDRSFLASTAISAEFLQTQMSRCRARSIVLLLDCCYSGAFLPGIKGDSSIEVKDQLHGHGRAVLTASNRTEYAWEGDHLSELEPEPSHFTGAVIEGLRSGEADRDRDGKITVLELYDYIYDRVRAKTKMQTPQMWSALEYQVVVARSPFVSESAVEMTPPLAESAVTLTPAPKPQDSEQGHSVETDPSRRDSIVARLKRALPDPVRRIEVFDLVDKAVTDIVANSAPDRRPVIGSVFVENIQGYRTDSDTLLHMLAAGVFHDDGSHHTLWVRVVERLSRLRDKSPSSFTEGLERLRLYPALLAIWTMGVAAILSRQENLLATLLTQPVWDPPFSSDRRQNPVRYLNPIGVIDGNSIKEICNPGNGGDYYYPQSHYLRRELRDPFHVVEPDDSTYMEACNRFEFLASMIAMDMDRDNLPRARPWIGEFLLDSSWGYGEVGLAQDICQEINPSWPLLAGGAFGGDPLRAEAAFNALVEFRRKYPRW